MGNKYAKRTLIEVVKRTNEGNYLVHNEGNPSDIWEIPEGVFLKSYVMVTEVDTFKTITELCREAYQTANSKGWYDSPVSIPERLALIHSEVSESLEADRKGDLENFKEELADVCIRIFDLCGWLGIDLEKAIEDKMEFNKSRPYKHGGKKY